MELFVNACYFLSMLVFCAGTVAFIVWEAAAISYWNRQQVSPCQEQAQAPSRQATPAALKLEAVSPGGEWGV